MKLSDDQIAEWARHLSLAAADRIAVPPITQSADLSVDDAYRIQAARIALQLEAGERVVGAKIGLTSKAKQLQMGVDQPIFGVLTDAMELDPDDKLVLSDLIHPRCEPEIVFRLANDLAGPSVTPFDVVEATATIHGGIEVIDSRYEQFSFTLPDVIADNTSAARFLVGAVGVEPKELDLATIGCLFERNGHFASSATSAALLGNPALAVAHLVKHMSRYGQGLSAGSTVLGGGVSDAIAIAQGDAIVARYAHLGEVRISTG